MHRRLPITDLTFGWLIFTTGVLLTLAIAGSVLADVALYYLNGA